MHDFLLMLFEPLKPFMAENGMWALFLFSYSEAVFQPIPVDIALGFMVFLGSWSIYELFFVAFIASILGGSTAYYLGEHMGKPIFIKLFGEPVFNKGTIFLQKWGMWSVLIAAATPIPFKVVAWLAGILHMPFWKFFIAQSIGRGARFAAALGLFELIKLWI